MNLLFISLLEIAIFFSWDVKFYTQIMYIYNYMQNGQDMTGTGLDTLPTDFKICYKTLISTMYFSG